MDIAPTSRRILIGLFLLTGAVSGADRPDASLKIGSANTALGVCEIWLPANYAAADRRYVEVLVADLSVVLTSRLGPTSQSDFELVLVDDRDQFNRWTSGESPHWIHALALQRPSRLVLLVEKGALTSARKVDLEQTLLHELTHAYLHRIGPQNSMGQLPAWFHEGVAVWMSGGYNASMQKSVLYARWLGQLRSLDDLSTIHHKSPQLSEIAYGQSALAIDYLLGEYGQRGLQEMIVAMRTGEPFKFALENVLTIPWPQFEGNYQEWLRKRFDLLLVLADPAVTFMILPLLVILAYFATQARARRRKRLWDEAERIAAEQNKMKNIDLFID